MRNLSRIACLLLVAFAACSSSPSSDGSTGGAGGTRAGGKGGSAAGTGGSASGGNTGGGGGRATGGDGSMAGTGGSGSGGAAAAGGSAASDAATTGDDGGTDDAASDAPQSAPGGAPLLALLGQFTAADVPMKGPKEADPPARGWTAPAMAPMRPGMGLAQHPMLYAGEGFNTIFLVNEGKVIWSYNTPAGGEIDDVWMLSNAHILYAHSDFLEELTPKKEVVWHYDLPATTQCHSLQPIGLDKVLFVANGQPAKIVIMTKATMMAEEHVVTDAGTNTHPQFRRIRMTADGTILAAYLEMRKVVEFNKDFSIKWNFPVPNMGTPWTALRLHNGNTLVQDEHNQSAIEFDPKGTPVWDFKPSDLPAGIMRAAPQTSERLANGNTVMFSPNKNVNQVQAVEVDQAKQVVWVLQDWKNLGPATTAQFLDQPGIPENPGDLVH